MSRQSYLMAADPAADLAVVQEMAAELEDYLIDDDVYRTLIISTAEGDVRLQSSGGDLLARLHRLQVQADQLTPEQRSQLAEIEESVDETVHSLRSRFRALLTREVKARLNSLKWFVDDCREDRRQCRTQYPFEIRNRQRIEEIMKILRQDSPEELEGQIRAIDSRLRSISSAAEFVWDNRVQDVYPQETYWYLYRLP